jgi:Circularly permutated YpsA SLOG family
MLDKIISGGQTGADQAGWRAATAFGVRTGGWMPKGFLTDDGPCPEFARRHGAAEMPTDEDLDRIERNVQDSDATLWLGDTTTGDAQATVEACHQFGRACLPVYPSANFKPSHVAKWISENQIRTLNVTGNREIDEPGIGDRVERFLVKVLQELGHQ